jgi:hypothetical protein
MSCTTPQPRRLDAPDSESTVLLEEYIELYEALRDYTQGKLLWIDVRSALRDAEYTITQAYNKSIST